ncbi:Cysteine desulfuration protein SufE [Fodinibius salinus]|uniref:Cysteine desulfuration protein SufE n=1 Tax=Fodinibius salinus TaxID=860790 RepID=A0A5D3YMP7_9BACT|nr:SufE family protein [Fodinibius salinus]TYP93987.1 Cysteine desulfuration protein SufE [Fodinibius salinus]
MADIHDIEQRIIKEFKALGDWTERYKHIIDQGRNLEPLDEEHKIEENLVRGCQSQVWLHTHLDGENVIFEADSDAAITKGLVALMVRFYSGQSPETIINTDPRFIKKIGMEQHLSPTRSNGLASMVKQMKIYAMAYKTKLENSKEEA